MPSGRQTGIYAPFDEIILTWEDAKNMEAIGIDATSVQADETALNIKEIGDMFEACHSKVAFLARQLEEISEKLQLLSAQYHFAIKIIDNFNTEAENAKTVREAILKTNAAEDKLAELHSTKLDIYKLRQSEKSVLAAYNSTLIEESELREKLMSNGITKITCSVTCGELALVVSKHVSVKSETIFSSSC